MMLECWICDGKGSLFKDRADAEAGTRTKCIACNGSGKLHDDADAFSEEDRI